MTIAANISKAKLATAALAAIGVLAGILLLGPAGTTVSKAHAQGAAACPQYQTCKPTQPPKEEEQPTGKQGENPPGGAAGPSGGQGGELPFTGYPLTPLILLLLLLLAAGLTIRGYVAARDRLRTRHAGPGGGYPLDIG